MHLSHAADPAGRWAAVSVRRSDLGPGLARVVGYEERAGAPVLRRELPTTSLVMVLNLGPSMRVGQATVASFVAGLGTSPAATAHDGSAAGVQVDLEPLAAFRLLGGRPLDEIGEGPLPLDQAVGPSSASLVERLADMGSWERRLDLVQRQLGVAIAAGPEPEPAVAWASHRLEASAGRLAIGALADEIGCSRRHLVSLFRRHVGLPPKAYARLLRFRAALRRLDSRTAIPLERVAVEAGYFDQAHFTNEFSGFAGTSPARYLAHRHAHRSHLSKTPDLDRP